MKLFTMLYICKMETTHAGKQHVLLSLNTNNISNILTNGFLQTNILIKFYNYLKFMYR